jgi:glycosyltransferase involved in cell wall biosynthesis
MNQPKSTDIEMLTEPQTAIDNSQNRQLKILLSAYACEPGRGSEPGVGWHTAKEIAQHHQVWVLTSNTHKVAIEGELSTNPIPNLHFVYLDPFGWVYDWSQQKRLSLWDVHLHCYLWQIRALSIAKRLHKEIKFDISHHVTYVKYAIPSFLWLLPIPFIWGPVGGAETAPKAFWQDFNLRAKTYEYLRNLMHRIGEIDPFVHLTARKSDITWVTTEQTAKPIRRMGGKNVDVVVESGLTQSEIEELALLPLPDRSLIRFISMGRLLHWKGFHLGLKAFAKAQIADAEYYFLGDGPELERLQVIARNYGISDRVKFLGQLSRQEALRRLGESHVLVHPSLHDSGGWVCLEAMASGRPIICLDLGGPGVQVTPDTGFKISAQSPEQVIEDIAKVMIQLSKTPELIEQKSQAGKKRVLEEFSWQSRSRFLVRTYRELLSKKISDRK